MAKIQDSPVYDPVIEGNDGKMRLSWVLFMQQLAAGDPGTTWVPNPINLGSNGGAPRLVGLYYQNQGWTDFSIYITPIGDTSSVAGSTYFELPFTVATNAPAAVNTGISSIYTGGVDSATKRCYTPTWNNLTIPLTVTGRVKN